MGLLWNPTVLTCTLTIGDWKPCTGIQKITGFSRGWHHWNSIRLGYNRSEGTNFVRLWLYTYVKGKRNEQLIGTCQVGTKLDIELEFKHHVFAARIRGEFGQYSKVQYAPIWFPFGYQLYPYAEIDGDDNKRVKFDVEITDLMVR